MVYSILLRVSSDECQKETDGWADLTAVITKARERNNTMEKYIKPEMEIVELEKNLVIVTSCTPGTSEPNEGPMVEF